jgi:hypothetical protein
MLDYVRPERTCHSGSVGSMAGKGLKKTGKVSSGRHKNLANWTHS